MFVMVPYNMLHYITELMEDMRVDVKESRKMTKPEHSDFWKDGEESKADVSSSAEEESSGKDVFDGINFTMEWDDEAKNAMKEVPDGILEMAVGNAEEFAKEKGYKKVSKKSIDELMKKLGMEF